VEVRPLTLAKFAFLHARGSPFARGGVPTAEDVALFLWMVSPAYDRAMHWQNALTPFSWRLGRAGLWLTRYCFVRRLRGLRMAETVQAINAWLDEALRDAPKGGGSIGPAYWSAWAHYVGVTACETGFSERALLTMPTKRLFQYFRIALKRIDPERHLFNASGELIAGWLSRVNAKNTEPKS
jgi:hypothetical protein